MISLLKGMALFVAVTCVVWVAVLWNWETTNRNMTTADIVVYLGVLPLFVFGVLLGLRWAWRTAEPRRAAAAAAAAAATASAGTSAATASPREDAQRHATVQLLAAHIACAAGTSPPDLLDAAKQNQPRPAIDTGLRDGDGFGVMCARIPDLAVDTLAADLRPLADAEHRRRPEWSGRALGDHVVRALAALDEPLKNALQALHPWATRLGAPDPSAAVGRPPAQDDPAQARVRLVLGWPAGWDEFEREVAGAWVERQAREHAHDIPPSHITLVAHTGSGEDLWLQADSLLQTMAREGRDDAVLLAACHSDLSEAAVSALEQQGRLFSARSQPKGLMPGEAAAALLLANPGWPADAQAHEAAMHLHRPAVLRRDKSIEAPGRTSSECLQETARQALAAARLEPTAIAALICDADQHTARGTELFGATLALLPELDPGEDMRLIGTVTGHVGAVNGLLIAAAAAQRARQDDKPCLALALGDRHLRLALVARPPEPSPSLPQPIA